MKQTIYAPNTVPTANVAVNKSRLKVYKNAGNLPTYYLQKGTEFQIEIANTTTDVILAKVILNGKPISQGGLVLNPGQRVFLERYLDVAKKFLFDTYEVSGSDEMKQAIANNGDIKVEFYKELEPLPLYNQNFYAQDFYIPVRNQPLYNSGTPPYLYGSTTSGTIGNIGTVTTTNTGMIGGTTNINATSFNASNSTFTSSSLSSGVPLRRKLKASSLTKYIETGRVEKGDDSKQEFKTVNKKFNSYAFHTVEYKLLPVSQKVNTLEDINVKVYCTNCGAKLGKTDRFCASCGTKK